MKHSISEFKREAASGLISLELTERYGEPAPDHLRGIRTVASANTVSISLLCTDGHLSELRTDNPSMMEYTGDTLTVYDPLRREMTDAEKDTYSRYIDLARSSGWWTADKWISKTPYPYLKIGNCDRKHSIDGKTFNGGIVTELKVKDRPILRYTIHHSAD